MNYVQVTKNNLNNKTGKKKDNRKQHEEIKLKYLDIKKLRKKMYMTLYIYTKGRGYCLSQQPRHFFFF